MVLDSHVHITESIELLLKNMEIAGVERSVVCSSRLAQGEDIQSLQDFVEQMNNIASVNEGKPKNVENIFRENRYLAQKKEEYSNKLLFLGKVDLRSDSKSIKSQLDQIHNLGLAGVGEITGIPQNFMSLKNLMNYNKSKGYNLPLFAHADDPVDRETINKMVSLAQKYNEIPFIMGHLGGKYWTEVVEKTKTDSNLFLEISEISNAIPIKVAAREVPGQVIFGSDFPWDFPQANLARLANMDISKKIKEKILYKNAASIFDII